MYFNNTLKCSRLWETSLKHRTAGFFWGGFLYEYNFGKFPSNSSGMIKIQQTINWAENSEIREKSQEYLKCFQSMMFSKQRFSLFRCWCDCKMSYSEFYPLQSSLQQMPIKHTAKWCRLLCMNEIPYCHVWITRKSTDSIQYFFRLINSYFFCFFYVFLLTWFFLYCFNIWMNFILT